MLVTVTEGDRTDAWGYELDREATTRLTFEASNGAAIWTPDASRTTFGSDRLGPFNLFLRNCRMAVEWRRVCSTVRTHSFRLRGLPMDRNFS